MTRRVTAGRQRIQPRRLTMDREGYVYLDGLKIARYNTETSVLQFRARRADRNGGQGRMVEVSLIEFVDALTEDIKNNG